MKRLPRKFQLFFAAMLPVTVLSTAVSADLLITELSTKSAVDPEDYFELTNVGNTAFDITGWQFDDESADINEAAALMGITSIAAGESVIFFGLDSDPVTDEAVFRGLWGGLAGVQVGYYDGAGLGKGDAINLFDALDTLVLTLEYGMTLPEQTHAGDWAAGNTDGSDTFENEAAIWVPGSDPQQFVLAQAGVLGSFANTSGEFGSPGVALIPEPTSFALVNIIAIGSLAGRRRRQVACALN